MTHPTLLQLVADKKFREIDALVAKHVMGWPPASCHAYWHDPDASLTGEPKGRTLSWSEPTASGQELELPHYSTDISAAWEVVEWLRARDFIFEVSFRTSSDVWEVQIWEQDGDIEVTRVDTAPIAICLAALKTVMHD